MKATVAERGQVTIPKALRERLGIAKGTILNFSDENGKLIAEKAVVKDAISQFRGCLKLEKSTMEILKEMRGV